jgi:hypothetical protein
VGVYKIIEKKRIDEIERQKAIAVQVERDNSIKKRAKELDADYSWTKEVDKILEKNFVLLSYQLEKLWIIDKPILFLGEIIDVKRESESSYVFKIKKSLHEPVLVFNLELRISCENKTAKKFINYMDAHKTEFEFEKSIAVLAKINSIENETRIEDGTSNDVKIGIGNCVDLLPSTGNYEFTY